jgi:predicted transcriptional regulator of viral defense system
MANFDHIHAIAELSESEGVFTTAQAARMGISRDALHDATESGRIERILRGAYRLVGSGFTQIDELVAIWKLTSPDKFAYERMQPSGWDGIVIGGSTAASVLGLGDFYLSPYRIFAPKRINSRNKAVNYAVRNISRREVSFVNGLPITRPERTIFDLVVDSEDMSLVSSAFHDAVSRDTKFDLPKLVSLFLSRFKNDKTNCILNELGAEIDASEMRQLYEI